MKKIIFVLMMTFGMSAAFANEMTLFDIFTFLFGKESSSENYTDTKVSQSGINQEDRRGGVPFNKPIRPTMYINGKVIYLKPFN